MAAVPSMVLEVSMAGVISTMMVEAKTTIFHTDKTSKK
jgi:hypothetical protein